MSVPGLFYQTGQTALKKQKEITRVWLLFSYSFNIADSVGKFPLHLFVPAGSANAPYNLSLVEKMGFWKELPLTWEQEKMLRDEFEQSFVKNKVVFEETLYSKTEPLAATARKVMSQIAMIGWTSGSHTAEYVPVYAVGAGSKEFAGKYDNTEIPKRIAKVAGYK